MSTQGKISYWSKFAEKKLSYTKQISKKERKNNRIFSSPKKHKRIEIFKKTWEKHINFPKFKFLFSVTTHRKNCIYEYGSHLSASLLDFFSFSDFLPFQKMLIFLLFDQNLYEFTQNKIIVMFIIFCKADGSTEKEHIRRHNAFVCVLVCEKNWYWSFLFTTHTHFSYTIFHLFFPPLTKS